MGLIRAGVDYKAFGGAEPGYWNRDPEAQCVVFISLYDILYDREAIRSNSIHISPSAIDSNHVFTPRRVY